LRLQALIRKQYEEIKEHHGQIVIYGKPKHPEVIGLNGQTNNSGIIVENKNDLDKIDYNKPIRLFSQTTGNIEGFDSIIKEIKKRKEKSSNTSEFELEIFDTICRKVANRANQIREFAKKNDLVIFVSDKKSSNGKYLFGICKSVNKNSYYISDKSEIKKEWFRDVLNVGISGATSTPGWLMEEVSNKIKEIIN
ncbi:MAG: 4-hydroxy-3-methylbut-2-enyl diphosphate reductase, partial [Bacteroidales bacterium]|nr:4-hydroxy-3-methylbut-2-enyl diphosphate reductase [Bacteroidales bacterium]